MTRIIQQNFLFRLVYDIVLFYDNAHASQPGVSLITYTHSYMLSIPFDLATAGRFNPSAPWFPQKESCDPPGLLSIRILRKEDYVSISTQNTNS